MRCIFGDWTSILRLMEEDIATLRRDIERYKTLLRAVNDEQVLRELERLIREAERGEGGIDLDLGQ
jgi:hypothetical protein